MGALRSRCGVTDLVWIDQKSSSPECRILIQPSAAGALRQTSDLFTTETRSHPAYVAGAERLIFCTGDVGRETYPAARSERISRTPRPSLRLRRLRSVTPSA